MRTTCTIASCAKPEIAKGLCHMHYRRARKGQDMLAPQHIASPGEPLAFLIGLIGHQGDDCIPWIYASGKTGYPHILYEGHHRGAHRVMCLLEHGAPPTPKHHAAHSCGNGNKGCVNPRHLRWATPKENAADAIRHGTSISLRERDAYGRFQPLPATENFL